MTKKTFIPGTIHKAIVIGAIIQMQGTGGKTLEEAAADLTAKHTWEQLLEIHDALKEKIAKDFIAVAKTILR